MNRPFAFPALVLTLTIVFAAGSPARADIPPSCGGLDSLITCAATDVGKPCQGGGKCFEMSCSNGASAGKVYRCDACPTIIEVPAGTCSMTNIGTTCGNGGTATCGAIAAHCGATSKFACRMAATETPTGPPSQPIDNGAEVSSGCDVAPVPGKPTLIGLSLVAAGIVFFLVDRARRRSR